MPNMVKIAKSVGTSDIVLTFRQALAKLAPAGARRIFDYLRAEHGDEILILKKAKLDEKHVKK